MIRRAFAFLGRLIPRWICPYGTTGCRGSDLCGPCWEDTIV